MVNKLIPATAMIKEGSLVRECQRKQNKNSQAVKIPFCISIAFFSFTLAVLSYSTPKHYSVQPPVSYGTPFFRSIVSSVRMSSDDVGPIQLTTWANGSADCISIQLG
jgi:hypothetical protein